jgi:alkanesulfonate monooxygenase SsuD/methylene tetrahydromethanopterin reductase-like flavin-dependent oxidoreductase (luciferase family)
MQYGLTLPNVGVYGDARTLADLALLAEEAGWDGFFLWDTIHYQAEEQAVCDPWIALATIAMRTERIKIGTMVAAPTRRRPWKMARETITLDHLSNGRFILGVGAGDGSDRGFTDFGEESDVRKRAKLLDESLEILQGLWSGQPFSYSGEHYHIKEITFLPPPVQTPRIPIWIGGIWPRKGPMSRAARFDGVSAVTIHDEGAFADLTPAEVHQLKLFMNEHRTTPAPFDIVIGGRVFDAVHDEQARAMLRAYAAAGTTWCLESIWPQKDFDDLRASIRQGPPRLE